jgi:prolyl-tRNA synthetase
MRWTQTFIPTLRDVSAEAEAVSHRLLLRAGYIRQLSAGVYAHLPLARRSLLKIMEIIRQEMNAIGAQEFYLPILNPAELWRESGRWDTVDILFKLRDRNQHDLCLGITHEEGMTSIARGELQSYKQLPQIWYQIQEKFRDEPRPKSGLLRLREFFMKDSYSFDVDEKGLDSSYEKHVRAYTRIFQRCGVKTLFVEAFSGMMGGSVSGEFTAPSEAGEDLIAVSDCGYAANLEKAVSGVAPIEDSHEEALPVTFETPGQKTIEDLVKFTGESPARMIKTLVYVADSQPVLILMRGDQTLSETKLSTVLGTTVFRPGTPEEVLTLHGANPGSLGPVGMKNVRILADKSLEGRRDMIAGANQNGVHMRHVAPGRDFEAEYHDLRLVATGDPCIRCGQPLQLIKGIELGHVFKLGRRYSDTMHATILNAHGREVALVMGSYGIGVERILTAAVEQNHDEDGMFLPRAIAPFDVILTAANMDDGKLQEVAEEMYAEMQAESIDVLFDDRDERAGVKFKDADLIGVPIRVTLGRRMLEQGRAEVFVRSTRSVRSVGLNEAVRSLREHMLA